MDKYNINKIRMMIVFVIVSVMVILIKTEQIDASAKINNKKATLIVGQKLKLKVTGTKKKVKWSSSKKTVAKVSKNGKVKALKKGYTVIKAKVGKKVLKCKVKVEKPVINKKQEWIAVGQNSKLKLKGNTQKVVWKSSDTNVVTVSEGKLKAISEGKATIKAKIGTKSYSCVVYVSGAEYKETIDNIKEVIKIVNCERRNRKLNELDMDYNLCMASIERCKELKKEFSHTRPNGEKCYSIIKEYGYKMYSMVGENIACRYTTSQKVMEGWMGSIGHRKQILEAGYEKIGVGFYYDEENESCYWSQLFYAG